MLPKGLRDLRYWIFYSLMTRRGYKLETLGDESLGVQWTVWPEALNAQSVVYSGGVGQDISFEHALVRKFGCNIVLLDPSPTGKETMLRPENQGSQLRFLPWALSARSASIKLAPPEAGGISWYANAAGPGTIEVESVDVAALMARHGHTQIDLLKLDIEGCEYEVIDDILKRRIPVRQLCADFDYGYVPGVRRSQAIRAMLKLAAHGYRLISHEGGNHTFVKRTIAGD